MALKRRSTYIIAHTSQYQRRRQPNCTLFAHVPIDHTIIDSFDKSHSTKEVFPPADEMIIHTPSSICLVCLAVGGLFAFEFLLGPLFLLAAYTLHIRTHTHTQKTNQMSQDSRFSFLSFSLSLLFLFFFWSQLEVFLADADSRSRKHIGKSKIPENLFSLALCVARGAARKESEHLFLLRFRFTWFLVLSSAQPMNFSTSRYDFRFPFLFSFCVSIFSISLRRSTCLL